MGANTQFNSILVLLLLLVITACGGGAPTKSVATPNTTTPVNPSSPVNTAPIAEAGSAKSVIVANNVTLIGTGTDSDNDSLSYTWSLLSAPSASRLSLSNNNSVNLSFVPDVAGEYVLSLVVNDGVAESAVDTVTVTVTPADIEIETPLNLAPIANAGIDQSSLVGLLITLSGGLSTDPNGDLISYTWSLISVPAGSHAQLIDPNTVMPTFTADNVGDYIFALEVSDGELVSEPDSVIVSIATNNAPPTADAGVDQNVSTGTVVNVSGLGSRDTNGDALTYRWSIAEQPTASNLELTDTNIPNISLTPVEDGVYILQLIVNDGLLDSAPETMTINAQTVNSTPIANAGNDQKLLIGQLVSLSGENSTDSDNDVLNFHWSFVSVPNNSNVSLDDETIVNPQFMPDQPGSYVLNLVVNDGVADSIADTIIIDLILPHITLQRLSRGTNPVYEDVPFPFENQFAVVTASVNALNPPNFYSIDRFKFSTVGQAYTISGISVGSTTSGFTAFIQDIQTGLVLTDNTVIPADSEFEFVIGALFTNGEQISLRFTFEISQTNEKFDITYNYKTTFI